MDLFLKPPLLLQKIMLFHRKYDGKALESKMSFKELLIKGKSQNADSIENIFWLAFPAVEIDPQWFLSASSLVLFGTSSVHFQDN